MAHGRAIGAGAALLAAGALLAGAREAAAATDCALGSGVLDVSMTANGDGATLRVEPGGERILVLDEIGAAVACVGPVPTVANTNAVSVHNAPGLAGNGVAILEAGGFAPGLNAVGENGGTPEIEIFVNLNQGGDGISVTAPAAGGALVLGAGGLNPNATEGEVAPDADVILSFSGGAIPIELIGGPGADLVSSAGGGGTGAPMPFGVSLQGGGGDDVVTGGSARDLLFGEAGDDLLDGGPGPNDALSGGDGDDVLLPGSVADPVDGGAGIDEARYSTNLGGGIVLDLERDPVAAESIVGTAFADVLRGDAGPNTLIGLAGEDLVEGRGGVDALGGGVGDDAIAARDGGADVVNCGGGLDTVTADPPGAEDLLACESVLFPPPLPAPPPGSPPGPAPPLGAAVPPGGAAAPLADGRRPRLVVRARPRQRAGGAIRVRVRSDEACALTVRGRARPRGRRGGGLRPRRIALAAGEPRALRLRPARALARALRAAAGGRARLVATCSDPSGNSARAAARVRLVAR